MLIGVIINQMTINRHGYSIPRASHSPYVQAINCSSIATHTEDSRTSLITVVLLYREWNFSLSADKKILQHNNMF